MARGLTFNMRLSEEENARLTFLTDHYGINTASLVRMLLKKEEAWVRSAIAAATAGTRGPRRGRSAD